MEINANIIAKTVSCNFSKTCLENPDMSLCCDIVARRPRHLIVHPVSTFKSSNCSYKNIVTEDGRKVQECSCPVRIEIFDKYGI